MRTIAELQSELRELGLPVSGRKAELAHRLHLHHNPITHGVPRSPNQLQNPKTRAESSRLQKEHAAHRVARGVPLGIPIGKPYHNTITGEYHKRLYAEDALPHLTATVKRTVRALPPITCIPCGSRDDTCTCTDAQMGKVGEQE